MFSQSLEYLHDFSRSQNYVGISETALIPGSDPLFGLNTLGGALSIRTKDGYTNPGTTFQIGGGSYGRRIADLEHGASHGRWNYYGATSFFFEDGWRQNSPSNIRQFLGKLGWQGAKTMLGVSAIYANNQLNGSDGNPDWSNQKRASEHATIALDMRIRLGADLEDDGVGGLKWSDATSTWTAPLEVLDDNGDPLKPTKSSKRSCFDVIDHPSMNQFYSRGGIYEPGYDDGSKSNARYNSAVDATWGITMQRFYPADATWRFWRPGFYGSFTVTRSCRNLTCFPCLRRCVRLERLQFIEAN